MRRILSSATAGYVLCIMAGWAAAQTLPTDPALVTGQLDNGLRYLVRQHANQPGRANVWLHIHSGSLNETDRQRGLAHYLEHMAFNGSENFPPGSVVPFFQSLGMTFGRDQNAFTSFEQTTYQLTLPHADPDSISKGLTYFADVLSRLLLLPEEIDAERQIIQEERISSLSGRQRTMYYVLERIAPGSIFGQRIVIGTEETINSVQQADFQDYYQHWYVASNATLMVVADTDPQAVVPLIEQHFGSARAVPRPIPQNVGVKPYSERFAIVASDPEIETEQVSITRLEPARPAITTVSQFRDDLVSTFGQRAFNRRVEDKAATGNTSYLSGSVSAGNQAGALYLAELRGRAKPSKWRTALRELAIELQRARLYGFSQREIDDIRKELISSARQEVETEATTPAAMLIRSMNTAVTDGEPIMSARQRLDLIEQLVPSITVEEVGKRFTAEFDPAVYAVTAILPASADVPTRSELLEVAAQALAVQPDREAAVARATQLMDSLPKAGEVRELAEHASAEVWSGWLSNNVRFHYRYLDTLKNVAMMRISLIGGELHETAENRGITNAATCAWARPATTRLSSADIRSLMTGKQVMVSGGSLGGRGGPGGGMGVGSANSISLMVFGSPQDFEAGMQLAHLLLTEPKLEDAAFTQFATDMRSALQQAAKNPEETGRRAMAGAPYPADVARTQPLTLEQLDRLDRDAAQAQLDWLIRTSPIEVAVVGDLPRERALELLAQYLGSLPARRPVEPGLYDDLRKLDRPVGPRMIDLAVESETQKAFVYLGFYGPDQTNVPDVRSMTLATRILSTRMIQEVREQEQLVYGISAALMPGATYPGFGTIASMSTTDPGKADRLLEKVTSMFGRMATEEVSEEELSVAKLQIDNTLRDRMREPAFWLGCLAQMTFDQTDLDDVMEAPAAYQAITAEQVRDAFARYYAPATSLAVRVLPVEKP